VHGPSLQAAAIHGDVYFGTGPARPRHLPRQLPPAPRHFTGRLDSLADLDATLTPDGPSVAVISGPPGVGKSALAVSWLRSHRADFPDGQLYVDLRGHLAEEPVAPSSVLPRFLHALGVRPEHVPTDLPEQTALYRSLTADLRIAVLCDNAFSAAQTRPLAPAGSGSICVVTSRRRLNSLLLDGARVLPLEPLDADSAVQLLGRIAGRDRIADDEPAAQELVASCGRFPLAVCVGAALLSVRPGWSIADVAADLLAETRSGSGPGSAGGPGSGYGSGFDDEEFSMNACLDQAYSALPPTAARLYRRLGLHPGPEFAAAVARAVAAVEPEVADVSGALAALIDANLLSRPSPGRYRFHDLIHRHAISRAAADDPGGLRTEAVQRVLDHYLLTANGADHVLYPQRHRPEPHYFRPPSAQAAPAAFPDAATALDWFEAERGNLMAAQRLAVENGMNSAAWQLADSMWSLFSSLRYRQDWIAAHEIGAVAAGACGHRLGEARLRMGLGIALRDAGRHREALTAFADALALRREIGDRRGEALVLHHTALTHRDLGDQDRAVELLRAAQAVQEETGDRRALARNHAAIGETESLRGRHEEAIGHLGRAREMIAGTGDRYEALVERLLGEAYLRSGDGPSARPHLLAALDHTGASGVVFEEGPVCEALGELAEREGDEAAGRAVYVRAAALYQRLGTLADARRASEHAARLGAAGTG
jgi:tetratricopeptide (TPR) repeat protein